MMVKKEKNTMERGRVQSERSEDTSETGMQILIAAVHKCCS